MESTGRGHHPLAQLAGRRYILSVATFEPKKGLDVLIRAFAAMRRSGTDIALVLVGRVEEAATSLRALATELGLDDDVVFVEGLPHSQIGPFFEHASAFCLPSRAEPFGIVLLEAGAFHLPVVATRVGGIPEIIEDGESGLLVEPDDPAALVSALTEVLRDDRLARRLADRLFERVQTEFSWQHSYAEYRRLVRSDGPANG
jgi:glycosyltransferase involved in cell wall biosynthesis